MVATSCSGTKPRGSPSRPGQRNAKLTDGVDVLAQLFGQPHDDIEAPVAFEDLPRFRAAERRADGVLHVGDVEAQRASAARSGVICRTGRPVTCSTFTSWAPRMPADDALDLARQVAQQLHRDRRRTP